MITQQLTVTLPDGARIDVQTSNADQIRWEITSATEHWPPFKDAPVLWLTFLAFAAMQREGHSQVVGLKFAQFADCFGVDSTAEPEPVNPTQSEAPYVP